MAYFSGLFCGLSRTVERVFPDGLFVAGLIAFRASRSLFFCSRPADLRPADREQKNQRQGCRWSGCRAFLLVPPQTCVLRGNQKKPGCEPLFFLAALARGTGGRSVCAVPSWAGDLPAHRRPSQAQRPGQPRGRSRGIEAGRISGNRHRLNRQRPRSRSRIQFQKIDISYSFFS